MTSSSTTTQDIYDVLDELARDEAVRDADVIPALLARGITREAIATEFDDDDLLTAWRALVIEVEREREKELKAARYRARVDAIWTLADRLAAAARAAGYYVWREAAAESNSKYVTIHGEDESVLVRISDHAARLSCARHIDVSLAGWHESATRVVDPESDDLEQAVRQVLSAAIERAGPPKSFDDE